MNHSAHGNFTDSKRSRGPAEDTLSITTMEIVDNAIMLGIPRAVDVEVTFALFWGALTVALAVAFVVTCRPTGG